MSSCAALPFRPVVAATVAVVALVGVGCAPSGAPEPGAPELGRFVEAWTVPDTLDVHAIVESVQDGAAQLVRVDPAARTYRPVPVRADGGGVLQCCWNLVLGRPDGDVVLGTPAGFGRVAAGRAPGNAEGTLPIEAFTDIQPAHGRTSDPFDARRHLSPNGRFLWVQRSGGDFAVLDLVESRVHADDIALPWSGRGMWLGEDVFGYVRADKTECGAWRIQLNDDGASVVPVEGFPPADGPSRYFALGWHDGRPLVFDLADRSRPVLCIGRERRAWTGKEPMLVTDWVGVLGDVIVTARGRDRGDRTTFIQAISLENRLLGSVTLSEDLRTVLAWPRPEDDALGLVVTERTLWRMTVRGEVLAVEPLATIDTLQAAR